MYGKIYTSRYQNQKNLLSLFFNLNTVGHTNVNLSVLIVSKRMNGSLFLPYLSTLYSPVIFPQRRFVAAHPAASGTPGSGSKMAGADAAVMKYQRKSWYRGGAGRLEGRGYWAPGKFRKIFFPLSSNSLMAPISVAAGRLASVLLFRRK